MRRTWHSYLLAGCFGSLVSVGVATAQLRAGWRQLLTTNAPRLENARMAFDSARGVAVLVGRSVALTMPETWEWNGTAWFLRCGPGCATPDRGGFVLTYDATCQRVLMFGGYDSPSQTWFNEVWAWTGAAWSLQSTSPPAMTGTLPQRVSYSSGCYDEARMESVFYGGGTASPGGSLQNETWLLGQCVNWSLGPQGPTARQGPGFSYDASRQRAVLFGGEGLASPCPGANCDTHEWDGTSWHTIVPAHSPPGRYFHGQAYDRFRQRTVVFGGFAGSLSYGDTWEWDGMDWTQPALGSQSPSPREQMAMCYDEVRLCIILYGGAIPTGGWYADTWVYTPLAEYDVSGTGCPGTNGTPAILPIPFGFGPRLGLPFTIQITPVPSAAAVGILGFNDVNSSLGPLPRDLTMFGMPGCTLFVSDDALLGIGVTAGTALWQVSIPYDLQLLGASIFQQGLLLDPAATPLPLIVSNKGHGIIGLQ